MCVCGQKPGHEDAFYNNTCMLNGGGSYARFDPGVGGPALPVMHDNRVYAPAGAAVGEQRKTIAAWQAQGHDLGTAVATLPADAEVIAMARRVLGMPRASGVLPRD